MPKRKPANTTEVVAYYPVDGTQTAGEVPAYLTLKELQAFVGGDIERVPTTIPHRSLIVNEEGMLKDLPRNCAATKLVHPNVLMSFYIRGNALLVKS